MNFSFFTASNQHLEKSKLKKLFYKYQKNTFGVQGSHYEQAN